MAEMRAGRGSGARRRQQGVQRMAMASVGGHGRGRGARRAPLVLLVRFGAGSQQALDAAERHIDLWGWPARLAAGSLQVRNGWSAPRRSKTSSASCRPVTSAITTAMVSGDWPSSASMLTGTRPAPLPASCPRWARPAASATPGGPGRGVMAAASLGGQQAQLHPAQHLAVEVAAHRRGTALPAA